MVTSEFLMSDGWPIHQGRTCDHLGGLLFVGPVPMCHKHTDLGLTNCQAT